ncbi:MAG: hypothetical protein Q8S73_38530 [Deltaproteobacteria bacterium]|nr:hypothetical protein [Myxococcales bacterium]MDP3220061.1 hypothetical protein [Deltaproteobacteria bacterium]
MSRTRSINRERRRVREAHQRAAARRVALLRVPLWCRLLPNLGFRFEAPVFAGIDFARTRCEPSLPPGERDQLYAALRAQLRAGVLVLPRSVDMVLGMDLALTEAPSESFRGFDELVRTADAAVSVAVCGPPALDLPPRSLPIHHAGDPE